ncbi:hypothetical protein [Mucilaginibacter rubeus]|uniref:Uncharacterized protein n=1 Tax=Mucilaginibacter rubeus TaxID=2027860 RepID=A0A5C1I6G0_9SPHI|nr:hypothetical protein [Mucilaginibacter rubeus]QEM13454.1 hypothetical protein DEO27_026740 [Mucilaginibacter rubeus]
MNRGSKTTIENLKAGDRFYKESDKKKQVWEITGEFEPAGQGKGFYYAYCLKDGGNPKYPDKLKSTLPVIFLRHK